MSLNVLKIPNGNDPESERADHACLAGGSSSCSFRCDCGRALSEGCLEDPDFKTFIILYENQRLRVCLNCYLDEQEHLGQFEDAQNVTPISQKSFATLVERASKGLERLVPVNGKTTKAIKAKERA